MTKEELLNPVEHCTENQPKEADKAPVSIGFYEKCFDHYGDGENYSGDCICSFNTLSGAFIRTLPDFQPGTMPITDDSLCGKKRVELMTTLIKSLPDDHICKKITKHFGEYLNLYHTLANFMPLPKYYNGQSVQRIRMLKYHDFIDEFLSDVEKGCYNCDGKVFGIFDDFNDFIDKNYLNCYIGKDLSPERCGIENVPYRFITLIEDEKKVEEAKTKFWDYLNYVIPEMCGLIKARAAEIEAVKKETSL